MITNTFTATATQLQVINSLLDDIDLMPYYEVIDMLEESGIPLAVFKRYYAAEYS